jgi:hypothetical protein
MAASNVKSGTSASVRLPRPSAATETADRGSG